VEVIVHNAQKDLTLSERSVEPIIQSVLSLEKRKTDSVIVYFVTKKKISALHKEFFNDPTPTDCISFPLDETDLGEVFVSPRAAIEYVKTSGGNVYEETTLYLVHGLLHLLGYDDLSDQEEKKMRAAEKRNMEKLKRNKKILEGCLLPFF
jgi:probable rRNA maturation factor